MPSLKNALSGVGAEVAERQHGHGLRRLERGAGRRAAGRRRRPVQLAQRPLEIGAHVGSLPVAQFAVLLEQLVDDRREGRRQPGIQVEHRQRRAIEDGVGQHARGVAAERAAACGNFVQDDAERKQIRALIERFPSHLLGRHIGRRADRGSRVGQRRHRRRRRGLVVDELGDAEVEHLHVAARRNDDVGGFQVAMDDAPGVRRLERVGELESPFDQLIRRHLLADARVERPALEQLHHEIRTALVLADVIDRADVRMVDRRDGARLTVEPFERDRVAGDGRRKDFDRDVAIEPGVAGAIDFAHATGTDRLEDFVGTESCAR